MCQRILLSVKERIVGIMKITIEVYNEKLAISCCQELILSEIWVNDFAIFYIAIMAKRFN